MAALVVAIVATEILHSPLAFVLGALGLSSLVYSLLTMGILRGRGRIGQAAAILPIAGVGEVALLAILWRSGLGISPLSAFGVFCVGNVIGLGAGVFYVVKTTRPRSHDAVPALDSVSDIVPTSRQLLGFSLWLSIATIGVTVLPLVLRFAAAFDSYTVVAIIDVALVLFTIPQRMGAIIVAAVVPHATRALDNSSVDLSISPREHFMVIMPFVVVAIAVAFTPIVGWLFAAVGRPEYAKSAGYLALALLAGPARVLYGVVEGVLVAYGDGRFLAINSVVVAIIASVSILMAAALGSVVVAFAVFVIAGWAVYFGGLRRIERLDSIRNSVST